MVREQDLFFAAGPAVDFVVSAARARWHMQNPSRCLAVAACGVLGFALAFMPQAIAYLRLNGHVGPSRLVTRKMSWHAPHGLQVLFSPEHGYFVWTPLALVGIAGLVSLAVAKRHGETRITRCMLLMVALQVYVGGSVESWTVAGAFGQRRFIALTVFLVIGLATVLQSGAKRVVTVVVALAAYWNLALIAEFATGLMDRQRLEPAKNAYDAFVTLPRQAPSLAYRYLFDRGSFYRGPRLEGQGPGS
jgi:hypothetical protein